MPPEARTEAVPLEAPIQTIDPEAFTKICGGEEMVSVAVDVVPTLSVTVTVKGPAGNVVFVIEVTPLLH